MLEQHAPAPLDRPARGGVETVEILAEYLDGAGPLRHKAENGARQDRLARAGSTDETEDLAAIDVEIEPLHDRLLTEADLKPAHANDNLALVRASEGCVGCVVHGQ